MVFLRGYLPKCTIKISLWYIATASEDATFWGKKEIQILEWSWQIKLNQNATAGRKAVHLMYIQLQNN